MAWSANIDTIIEEGRDVARTYKLELRNGYVADEGGDWTTIPIKSDGWSFNLIDGNPVIGSARFAIGLENWEYLDEFNHANPVQLFADCKLTCSIIDSIGGGTESEIIFRGTLKTEQLIDANKLLWVTDYLDRLQFRLAPIDFNAIEEGPHKSILLDHAALWDDPGTFFTYEVDRIVLYDWAYTNDDIVLGTRRSWKPGVYELERLGATTWEAILPSEYVIDTPNGLVRFHNDQGAGTLIRVREITVYLEGSLEIAHVIEQMLQIDEQCPLLPTGEMGCGFLNAQLRIDLAGTFSFVNGSKAVVGIGTDFVNELEQGERFSIDGAYYGIVDTITNATNLVLLYNYWGPNIGPLAGFKSTLKFSGLSITNIKWDACDGTAAQLYRQIQNYYTDITGYKIWYNYELDQINGERVEVDIPNAINSAPKVNLKTTSTTKDFASAVAVGGVVGRANNLITDLATNITASAEIIVPPWTVGPDVGGAPVTWGGLYYAAHPIAQRAINDEDLYTAYAVHYNFLNIADCLAAQANWFDFIEIDLGDVYDISEIIAYMINGKVAGAKMGISFLGSETGVAGSFTALGPDTYQAEMDLDEERHFDLENIGRARFILVQCRPFAWALSGTEATMGLREIIIFGTQKICTRVCIQDRLAHGNRLAPVGTLQFNAGGPPYTVTGVGTNFGGGGANDPAIGDYIAQDWEPEFWGIVETIAAVSGVNCATVRYPYHGTPLIAGNLMLSKGDPPYTEGEGGHFIGMSGFTTDFIRDYYPDLFHKMSNVGHQVLNDEQGLVYTEMQAYDRAYLLLNESIRLYRQIDFIGVFDPRLKLFQTLKVEDDYREGAHEDLYFLIQKIVMSDRSVAISGTEFGAGALE